ncbi:hypothetical protein TNCT_532571 [Trichonephila clavata]|uniref:Uncharacterized protein n=1 Tax=Trichonephila clavata TaxID=2740835 RepID=A0A8X6KD29_TRICU|nr:hypothetical protein TNCT_532571 [Trichonephila clavata]
MYPHALVSPSVPEIEPQIARQIRERGGHVHQQLFPFAESEDEILRMIRERWKIFPGTGSNRMIGSRIRSLFHFT